VTAQGQFGPSLAGTSLSFDEFYDQVRKPRDKMLVFDKETVNDEGLRHIYAWLVSLPRPVPTLTPVSTFEAEAQARDRLYPELGATALVTLVDELDELTFRVSGQIVTVESGERFTSVRLRVDATGTAIEVVGIYDTVLARQPFPAAPGDRATLYGVGAPPATIEEAGGASQRLPKMQILDVKIQ
jgi:hypothetical protein